MFYEAFQKDGKIRDWNMVENTQRWKICSGLTFENICFNHRDKIIEALGLQGIKTAVYSWQNKGNSEMNCAQIDMIIDCADKCLNICKIKFNENPFLVTKKFAQDVRLKMTAFNYFTKNKKKYFALLLHLGVL